VPSGAPGNPKINVRGTCHNVYEGNPSPQRTVPIGGVFWGFFITGIPEEVVNMGNKKATEKMSHIEYMETVWKTPLQHQGKYLLSYYASRFNFKENQNCWATTETICREMQWSRGTVIHWKKYLQRLGWIKVVHRSNTSDYVRVMVGNQDEGASERFSTADEPIPHLDAIRLQ